MEIPGKIGKIESIETSPELKLRKTGIGTGNARSENGKNSGGGNGGDDPPNNNSTRDEGLGPRAKLRVVMWFTLLIVLMTFGALISAYVVLAVNRDLEWRPFELPTAVWISTAILIASSCTFALAKRNLAAAKETIAHRWFLITTGLGGVFVASQLVAWFVLYQRGVYLSSNPYAGFFYVFTAVHAVHVLGGLCALGYLVLKTSIPTQSAAELSNRLNSAIVVGWYWHFMDALWLVLFLLLGFWQ
jgi:cytochrome c oxidase subunit 3